MNRSQSPSRLAALMSLALAAGIAGCASSGSGAGAAAPSPAPAPAPKAAAAASVDASKLPPMVAYGDKGNVQPYSLFLGTPANFSTTVPQNDMGSLDAGAIKVEPTKVGDSHGMKFTWTGAPWPGVRFEMLAGESGV